MQCRTIIKQLKIVSSVTFAKKVMISPLSFCPSVIRITKKTTDQILMKFYETKWSNTVHGPIDKILSDFGPRSKPPEIRKSKSFCSVQNCRRESRQKLKCTLFGSLNISKCDYGVGLIVSEINKSTMQRGQVIV